MQTKQTDLARLLMGTKVFVVPQFQRHYKWKQAQWLELFEDILEQLQAEDVQAGNPAPNEGHFIGSIVLHPAPGPASTVARYWVIDGQQRLTTLLALLAALRDVRHELEPEWNPASYTNQYLSNPFNQDQPYRLVPGDNDREDFVATIYDNDPSGQIGDAYKWYRKQIRIVAAGSDFDFSKFESAILLRLIVVEINTSDDDNINQIFNTINHSGMRLSAIDLIRNHSFMQFDTTEAAEVYSTTWKPLEDSLGSESTLSQYMWAQLVRQNPKATQRDLYAPFQKHLKEVRTSTRASSSVVARSELERLKREASLFLAILGTKGSSLQDWGADLRDAIRDLHSWGSSTHLPITLEVLSRLQIGSISEHDATTSLRYLLSFLVRRGLCAIPTNNLNRILSAIPSSLDSGPVAEQLSKELLRGSKYWPTDREVLDRGLSSPIYHTLQASQVRFLLGELNDFLLPAETVVRDELTVEHIMPQVLTESWRSMFETAGIPVEVAQAKLHVIGNLTLTGQNSLLGQRSPFEKSRFLQQSNLPINRSAGLGDAWVPDMIDARSAELLRLAIEIWKRPSVNSQSREEYYTTLLPDQFTVASILNAIPPDSWLGLEDLAQVTGQSGEAVVEQVAEAGYHVLSRGELQAEVDGVPGLSDLDGFDLSRAARISIGEAVASLEKVGADAAERG
ncbi:MAG: DUF262 domain-containing protein [Angustibacter sp.]